MQPEQLTLDDKKDLIETVTIQPTKDMPEDVFCELWRLAFYMELMERVDDNHVVWDEAVASIYSETSAQAEYIALQNDWFSMSMEIPKVVYDQIKDAEVA